MPGYALIALDNCIKAGREPRQCYEFSAWPALRDAQKKLEDQAKTITDQKQRADFIRAGVVIGEATMFLNAPITYLIGRGGQAAANISTSVVGAAVRADSTSPTAQVTILISLPLTIISPYNT